MNADTDRRRFLVRALSASTALTLPPAAYAQGSPAVSRVLIGYPAGGSVDVVGRKISERLSALVQRNVIVENRPGAAGRLAVEALKSSAADGTTFLITPASVLTLYPHVYKKLSYDVFNDLAPVAVVALTAFALVVGSMVPESVRSVDDFAAWCKANPASAQCGNPGAGSLPHFMAMLWGDDAKVALNHVPYRGGSLAMQAAAGGQIASALSTESSALALERSGKLRVLATSGAERSVFLPAAPTFREAGYARLTQREWFGAFMPAKTARPRIDATAEAIASALREADVRETWHRLALSAESSTPTELAQALRSEHDFWAPIVKASGFTPEA